MQDKKATSVAFLLFMARIKINFCLSMNADIPSCILKPFAEHRCKFALIDYRGGDFYRRAFAFIGVILNLFFSVYSVPSEAKLFLIFHPCQNPKMRDCFSV